jgi:glycosyltransferase involved in cell wall biosynthesis
VKICLVTTEVNGPFMNGGIGTATTGLAQWLASEGHAVTILYTLRDGSRPHCASGTFDFWQEKYVREWNIELVGVPDVSGTDIAFSPALRISYAVHRWLADRQWDLIVFCDSTGPGYFATHAKSCGIQYEKTVLAVVTHGSHRWLRMIDEVICEAPDLLAVEEVEESAISHCDVVISPSHYMLEWMTDHLASLASERLFIPNILPKGAEPGLIAQAGRTVGIEELVFFGRLEIRKGIEVFCNGVDELLRDPESAAGLRRITFLGRCGRIAGEHAGAYVLRRSYNWPVELHFKLAASQEEALSYLREGKRLAVMPSIADNLPSVVIECLDNGIPFIAGDVGGAAEIVEPADHDRVLVTPRSAALATALRKAVKEGAFIARPAITRDTAIKAWREFLGKVEEAPACSSPQRLDAGLPNELRSSTSFDPGGRRAWILLAPGARIAGRGVKALLDGLGKAPLVTATWTEGKVLRAPLLDPGFVLTSEPEVRVCAVDASIAENIDERTHPDEACRQLVLAGHPYLILPEPFCDVSSHGEKEDGPALSPVRLGEQIAADAGALVLGRDFAARKAALLERCYDALPCGETLLALNEADHFGDISTSIALMAGFLNGVGRRREALELLDSWVNTRFASDPAKDPVRIVDLIATEACELENVLEPKGVDRLDRDAFMLHPNHPSCAEATCIIRACLFGHRRLRGTMELRNRESAAVRFEVSLRDHETVLGKASHIVKPGVPTELALAFDPVAGPIELRLSTSMADRSAPNFSAWATWRDLEFMAGPQ